MSNASAPQVRQSLGAILTALGAAVLSLVPLWAATRSVSYRFPDYGDLWRWAMNLHVDDVLSSQELFSETNLVGHNHVLTIWLSRHAAGTSDYSLLWKFGVLGVLFSAASLAYVTHRDIAHSTNRFAASALSICVALLAFRFDEGIGYFSSLLVFEQLFYFFALGSLLVGAHVQSKQLLGEGPSNTWYVVLGFCLVMGEAPTALSMAALAGMAVLGVVAFRSWDHLARLVAVIVGGMLIKLVLRAAAGGRGVANGPDSTFGFLRPSSIPDWLTLIGSSVFSFVGDRSEPAPDNLYLLLGIAIVAAMLAAIVAAGLLIERQQVSLSVLRLALGGVLLVAFSVLAAMFIIDSRADALNGRYDVGRFVRSTQFAMPGLALIGLAWSTSTTKKATLRAAAVGTAMGLLLLVRAPSALDVQDVSVFIANASDSRDAGICEPEPGEIEWRTYWANASDELVATFEDSPLFDQWRSEKCG